MPEPAFIPKVICAKCGVFATVKRVHKGSRRYIEVSHHGERQQIQFSPVPDQEITLWKKPDTEVAGAESPPPSNSPAARSSSGPPRSPPSVASRPR